MAEKVVSPGIFSTEKDVSFLPQGIGEIGAAFVGPTVKGPAFVPTVVESFAEFERIFGPINEDMYVPYAVKNYLKSAGTATVVRTLGTAGYQLTDGPILFSMTGSYGTRLISVLHPTYVNTDNNTTSLYQQTRLSNPVVGHPEANWTGSNQSGSFVFTLSGSFATDTSAFTGNAVSANGTAYSASVSPTNASFIGDIFGYTPKATTPLYTYLNFEKVASASLSTDPASAIIMTSGSAAQSWDFSKTYTEASTPWITSQKITGAVTNLFKCHTLSHGTSTNFEVKVVISNIRAAGTLAGTDYGSFTLVVRAVDQDNIEDTPYDTKDTDARPNVLETFNNLNLDPNSTNYIARRIGDRYITVDAAGKLSTNGDYANQSKYIRVEMDKGVSNGGASPILVPFGFASLNSPVPTGLQQPPSASFVKNQNIASVYNKKKPWGFDYDFVNTDNLNYLKPLPDTSVTGTGSNVPFYLGDYNQPAAANYPTIATAYSGAIDLTTNTSEDSKRFAVPFQAGFDGFKPNIQRKTGADITATNTQGFDLASGADGNTAYTKAINAISNQDEFDLNMLIMPGVLYQHHSDIAQKGIDLCENRADCFFPMDGFAQDATITTATTTINLLDSNYTATYYPWVKILDTTLNKPIWVPPSVVMGGVIAFTDKVAHEWFAPAGLNRGGITDAIEVQSRLTHAERDDLYEKRINPLATFPGEGVVCWGQKNLQAKPSALDRINVRRMLIAVKKFIASTTRYLIFEQNTANTRNQFLNIVNPYMESIQQKQGLYAFKVVMDESNNTPDVIDRNQLVGQIYLQPAKTVEFILLDFNILPTGAVFPE